MDKSYLQDIRYGFGLDIGIASVGWAIVALNEIDEPCGIVDMGARIFDAAEHPKNGASLALPRRTARSARRRIRRKAHRKDRIRNLLIKEGLLTQKQLDTLFGAKQLEDIYAVRARGLDIPLTNAEFARVLIHLSQRRGFRSNRKGEEKDEESGKLLNAVDGNRCRMEEGHYRSVGEMFAKDPFFEQHKRNKGGQYLSTVHRDMITDEAQLLFQRQRAFAQPFATSELENEYLKILLGQRSFDDGPGGDSPYGGNQIEKMRGTCTFEPDEKRAAKASHSFELFRFWEKLNHLRIQTAATSRALSPSESELILREALQRELTYHQIRTLLNLDDSERFNDLSYAASRGKATDADKPEQVALNKLVEKKAFAHFKAYHLLRRALDKASEGRILNLDFETLDAIGDTLSCYKQAETVREKLELLPLSTEDINALMDVPSFSGFAHLSCLACRKLLPFLHQGYNYDAACTAAGYEFRGHERKPQFILPGDTKDMEGITSPVVRRAVGQTVKVVNAIIRQMGHSPVFIKVELAREMAKDFQERREMEEGMQENAARNEQIMRRLRDEFHVINPTGLDLVKLKLYEEQQGKCAYTLEPLDIGSLFAKGYAEIDHIIPYSLCFDDSYNNKALVTAKANRDKGNRLPLQYLQGDARDRFRIYTQTAPYRGRKRRNLLKQSISEEELNEFKERNLQDTKHMSRFMYNYMTDYMLFEPFATGRKKHVTAVNGSITAHLRRRWGLSKDRSEGDSHHAQDAVVIACTTDGMITNISRYYQREEAAYEFNEAGDYSVHMITGEVFPLPWPSFRDDVQLRMQALNPAERLMELHARGRLPSYDILPTQVLPGARPLFVSRMPRRKVSGPAHKDTVKSPIEGESKLVVKRVSLEVLKLKDGEIENYYRPDDDPALYEALRERLGAHDGNAKKAFATPICKPGSDAPVRKVKVVDTVTLGVPVHGGKGLADNDSMVRIDVFHVSGDGYYLVPIYVADTVKAELPNRACIAHKAYDGWKEMREEDFVFSLYPNDLIAITNKEPVTLKRNKKDGKKAEERDVRPEEPLYYRGCDISSGKIIGCSHDNAYVFDKGLKRLQHVEKFQVDVLGNVFKVNRESRMTFR